MSIKPVNGSLRLIVLTTLATCSVVFADASRADEPEDVQTRSKIVWFSDLNLSHPDGVAELYRRIRSAAHRLCDDPASTVQYFSKQRKKCEREAIAAAVQRVGNEQLATLHRARKKMYG